MKSKSANADRTVYEVTDDLWMETDIIYTNRPSIGSAVATTGVTALSWVEFDVTSLIAVQLAGGQIVTLHVKDPVANNDIGIDFYSKEFGSNAPLLTVVIN